MQDDEIVLSPAKYQELEAELEHLTTTGRREIAERIKDARAMGDLSENFDYHDAKRQQGFLEGRIDLGSKVTVHDVEYDEDIEYTIVGVMEADAAKNRISNTSPLGKALIGHKSGERIEVQTPGGAAAYEIKAVS